MFSLFNFSSIFPADPFCPYVQTPMQFNVCLCVFSMHTADATTCVCVCRLFGFVARKSASASDNACHLFAELDASQPATAIVSYVDKLLARQQSGIGAQLVK